MFCPSAVVVGSFIKTSMFPYRGNRGWFRGCGKGGDVGRGPGRRCRGLWRGCWAKGRVRENNATGGGGHDGGWELVGKARPGSRFQKKTFLLGIGLEC